MISKLAKYGNHYAKDYCNRAGVDYNEYLRNEQLLNQPSHNDNKPVKPKQTSSQSKSEELQIQLNETVQLKVKGKKVQRWESEDERVVRVQNDGKIKGVSVGRTLVWAHLKDGGVKLFKVAVRK